MMKSGKFAAFVAFLAFSIFAHLSFAQTANDEIQESSNLLKRGQYALALDKINAYLSKHPKDARARFVKGLILAEQKQVSEAIKIFTALTEDYPELPEPYNNLAVLYAGEGQYDKARMALETAIRTNPRYATAYENLADVYVQMASDAYSKALQLDPKNTLVQSKLRLTKQLLANNTNPVAPAVKQLTPAPVNPTPKEPASAPTNPPSQPALEPAK